PTDPRHTPTIIQPSTQPQKKQQPRKPKRKDTQVPQSSDPMENVVDEAVYEELGDSLVRAATTASSLRAEQDSETMRDTIAQTRFESVSKHFNDSLVARGNTLQSDEDRLKLDQLMALCKNLQNRVLDLEKTKTTQHNEITTRQKEISSLKMWVKKLEKKNRSRNHRLKRLYKVGLTARVESSCNKESLGVVEVINTAKLIIDAAQDSATGDIVSAASAATTVNVARTTNATVTTVDDGKCKGILTEHVKPKKRKDQIRLDEEVALKLQAEFYVKETLAREKAKKEQEANISLIET
nr:hypothetical protein [Tanacetum cinerariifolium]